MRHLLPFLLLSSALLFGGCAMNLNPGCMKSPVFGYESAGCREDKTTVVTLIPAPDTKVLTDRKKDLPQDVFKHCTSSLNCGTDRYVYTIVSDGVEIMWWHGHRRERQCWHYEYWSVANWYKPDEIKYQDTPPPEYYACGGDCTTSGNVSNVTTYQYRTPTVLFGADAERRYDMHFDVNGTPEPGYLGERKTDVPYRNAQARPEKVHEPKKFGPQKPVKSDPNWYGNKSN